MIRKPTLAEFPPSIYMRYRGADACADGFLSAGPERWAATDDG